MKTILLLFAFMGMGLQAQSPTPVTVGIQTPHPGYGLRILRMDLGETHTHVLLRVIAPDADRMYPAVISEASETVWVEDKLPPVRLYLLNRSWNWGDETAVASEAEYVKAIGTAQPVAFRRNETQP
jgi:hypothetical protein